MIRVHKYIVNPTNPTVKMPIWGEVLKVAMQADRLCFWVKVDTTDEYVNRNFHIFITGEEIPTEEKFVYEFLGTTFTETGLPMHLFEKMEL